MPMLIPVLGAVPGEPEYFELESGEHFLGRLPSCLVATKNESVSRIHAKFIFKQNQWWVEDQHSCNGVLVNGRIITEHQLLDGDLIRTGEYYVVFSKQDAQQFASLKAWLRQAREKARQQAGLEDELLQVPRAADCATLTSDVAQSKSKFNPIRVEASPKPVLPPPLPWWKRPAVLVGFGMLVLLVVALIVWRAVFG